MKLLYIKYKSPENNISGKHTVGNERVGEILFNDLT